MSSPFLDDDNGPFIFEPLSSRFVSTNVELKTCPVRVSKGVGAICMVGYQRDEVDIGKMVEVEYELGPSTANIKGAISRPDRVLWGQLKNVPSLFPC